MHPVDLALRHGDGTRHPQPFAPLPTYFITDIHGELAKLDQLLHRLALTSADTLIFGGDYVDRGSDVYGVIERIRELSRHHEVVTVMGNHDEAFARGIIAAEAAGGRYDAAAFPQWVHGADKSYGAYLAAGVSPTAHLPWLLALEPYHVRDGRLFVHGGLNRHYPITDPVHNPSSLLLWDRDFARLAYHCERNPDRHFRFRTAEDFQMVFLGHTPTQHFPGAPTAPLLLRESRVALCDTGVGKRPGATLYAVDVETLEYVGHDGR